VGLCPLHSDHKPSFLLDDSKGLFYCYGCGRGGDVIRFVELYHQATIPQAVALLHSDCGMTSAVLVAAGFYRTQLHRYQEPVSYLGQRGIHSPEVIEHMRIGYAPGGCLRASLAEKGYPVTTARAAGLVNAAGHDSFRHRIVFPLEGNLYGRSILPASAFPHRFLPGSKGGLYGWDHVKACSEIILVEGLSTTRHCGRRVSTTSPARWAATWIHDSFKSCAAASEPSAWPSTPTATAAAPRPPDVWPRSSEVQTLRFVL
jgi:DNA primase